MEPFYWPERFERPIVLYTGPLQLPVGPDRLQGLGQITLDWRPSVEVRWILEVADAPPAAFEALLGREIGDQSVLSLEGEIPPPDGAPPWPQAGDGRTVDTGDTISYRASGRFSGIVGDPTRLSAVVLHLVNFIAHPGRSDLTFEAGGWRVVMGRPQEAAPQIVELRRLGGFGFTDVATIERVDQAPFDYAATRPIQDALFHLLAFAKGAHVGIALPVGIDENRKAVCSQWDISTADRWSVPLSWADVFHLDVLPPLFAAWQRWQADPFWAAVLPRAVRLTVSAHDPSPIEEAVTTAASGLELLAWAVLVIHERWLRPGEGDLNAAGRLRLLLKWGEIDSEIPPQLLALDALAAAYNDVTDGPTAITWVRNRIVHPPKRAGTGQADWPSHEQLVDAWRLSVEYLHLVLLRLLGHEGEFASRLHVEGRHVGTMTPVPWQTPYEVPGP